MKAAFSEAELHLISSVIEGTFHHEEEQGATLIFGSHTFPSHRITVDGRAARQWLNSLFETMSKGNEEAD